MILEKRIKKSRTKIKPIYEFLIKCPTCGTEKWVRNKRVVQEFCSHKCINRNRKRTLETLNKTSNSLKNFYKTHKVWNKGLSGERFSLCVKNSSKHKAAINTIEYKQHLRDSISGVKNGFYGKHHSLERRKIWSINRSKAIAEGKFNFKNKRGIKGWYYSSKMNESFYHDSFWELVRMIIFDKDKNVKTWTKRHGIKIPYREFRHYVPDFLINGSIIEEVKGGYESSSILDEKFKALEKYCIENNLVFRIIKFKELNDMCYKIWNANINSIRKDFLDGKSLNNWGSGLHWQYFN